MSFGQDADGRIVVDIGKICGPVEKMCGHNVLGLFVIGRKIWGCISMIPTIK